MKKPASSVLRGIGSPPAPGARGVGVWAAMAEASAWVSTLCVHTKIRQVCKEKEVLEWQRTVSVRVEGS